ncbi:MAG TPA: hypothetical protein DD412_07500 [Holosporales bacterium]|nr:hypothetical protein [Holosporales bacterium]
MKQLSIHSLLSVLLKKTDFSPLADEGDHTSQKVTTSIRLEPKVRKFVDIQAKSLGFGLNEFISMTLKAVMESSLPDKHDELDSSFFRFIDVFRKHNIALIDIPNFFGGEIYRSDLNDKVSLLNKLSPSIIKKTSEMFAVEENWLKGLENSPSFIPSNKIWYKNFENLIDQYFHYKILGNNVEIFFLLDQKETKKTMKDARNSQDQSEDINITVGLKIDQPRNAFQNTVYEIWDNERWNYIGARLYLKAILMFCRKASIRFGGYCLPTEELEKVRSGNMFLSECYKNGPHRSRISFKDYIINDELNPEKEEFVSVEEQYNQDLIFSAYEGAMKNINQYKSQEDLHAAVSKSANNLRMIKDQKSG